MGVVKVFVHFVVMHFTYLSYISYMYLSFLKLMRAFTLGYTQKIGTLILKLSVSKFK